MSVPSFTVSPDAHRDADAVVVIGVSRDADDQLVIHAHDDFATVKKLAEDVEASTSKESLTRLPHPETTKPALAAVGLGSATADTKLADDSGVSAPRTNLLRDAAGVASRRLAGKQILEFAFDFESEDEVLATLEGALLGAYAFNKYRQATIKDVKSPVEHVHIRTSLVMSESALERVREKASAVALVKDLVNTPAQDLYPESFADQAAALCANEKDVHVTIWDESQLATDGFGGILGVGKGSEKGPRLVKVDYRPQPASTHISLVGKGITFDTGGLSLKSGAGMMGMKYDMTGAATALAVILAVSRLRMPIHLTAWLCLAENMPSGRATRPNDILRIRGGKTVEVLNTDAEGRLVLADGLVAASEEHPDLIIDIATLTGAATTALGTRTVGLMGNTSEISHLVEVGQSCGESLWHMPLPAELRPLLNSEVADIANVKPGNTAGGMLIAGVFLRDFVGKTPKAEDGSNSQIPWMHLDIAGTANNGSSAYGFTSPGPTGVTVRSLIDYVSARCIAK